MRVTLLKEKKEKKGKCDHDSHFTRTDEKDESGEGEEREREVEEDEGGEATIWRKRGGCGWRRENGGRVRGIGREDRKEG